MGEILSDNEKLHLLEELCKNRVLQEKSLFMGDIYIFFPELKQNHIPEEVKLPSHITQNNLKKFITDLKQQLENTINPKKDTP